MLNTFEQLGQNHLSQAKNHFNSINFSLAVTHCDLAIKNFKAAKKYLSNDQYNSYIEEVYILKTASHLRQRDFNLVLSFTQQVIDEGHSILKIHTPRFGVLINIGTHEQVLAECDFILTQFSDQLTNIDYYSLYRGCIQIKNNSKALEVLNLCLEKRGNSYDLYLLYCDFYFKNNYLFQAAKYFAKAIGNRDLSQPINFTFLTSFFTQLMQNEAFTSIVFCDSSLINNASNLPSTITHQGAIADISLYIDHFKDNLTAEIYHQVAKICYLIEVSHTNSSAIQTIEILDTGIIRLAGKEDENLLSLHALNCKIHSDNKNYCQASRHFLILSESGYKDIAKIFHAPMHEEFLKKVGKMLKEYVFDLTQCQSFKDLLPCMEKRNEINDLLKEKGSNEILPSITMKVKPFSQSSLTLFENISDTLKEHPPLAPFIEDPKQEILRF